MRRSLFGVLWIAVLVLGIAVGQSSSEPAAVGQVAFTPSPSLSAGTLTTHVLPAEGGPAAVVVVDTSQRVLAVYHVDRATGEIALRSVRNLNWDLQMLEFNSGEPLPQDIRKLHGELHR